jgi:7-carboxy-7-deazaguanine synthase
VVLIERNFSDDRRESSFVGSMRADAQERKGVTVEGEPSTDSLRIVEVYASRQGEGRWAGTPSVFLRTSGCNLRCWFCDTPFASWQPEGEMLTIDQTVARALALVEPDVVVTGGEPLLFPAIGEVCRQLRAAGRRVTIETAGTLEREFECDLLSISPKLASSAPDRERNPAGHQAHQARRLRIDLVRRWIDKFDYQLKFVVGDLTDAVEVLAYLDQLQIASREHVWLMPEGTTAAVLDARAEWLVPWCRQHGVQYCPRSHIYWYGNRRGT